MRSEPQAKPRPPCRLAAALVFVLVLGGLVRPVRAAFDMDQVVSAAEKLAQTPWKEPSGEVPKWLLDLPYDRWRDIRYRPERALWREEKGRFTVQFFHLGMFYDRPVKINVVDGAEVHPVAFSPSEFDYGTNDFASRVPQNLGFAGFRIHYPIKRADYGDEVIVFLGASYFRAVGRDQVFGQSARGLAVDTAAPTGEEFPYFKEYWLVQPAPDATEMVIYALLDSPRITGAYRFLLRPGEQTLVQIQSRLFPRREIAKLGIAPLTSMFFHGENTVRKFEDFRPEVHDTDGLLLESQAREWTWRPLDNPETLQVNSFRMPNPKGFGLLQRDRDFDHYQDLEARPDLRPSCWVAPRGNWGDGRVELVEIPSKNEMNDNIVAYWVPARKVEPGATLSFAYDLYWYSDDRDRPPTARVVATRRDRPAPDSYRFIVDFQGPRLKWLPADTVMRGVVTTGSGADLGDQLLEQHLVKNPVTEGWRLGFQVRPNGSQPLELRALLQKNDETLTEAWSYTLLP